MAIEPIVLNAAGDTLSVVYSAKGDETAFFLAPGFRFTKIGEHGTRKHDIYLYELANSNAIVCPEVVLRLVIPKSIDTYGKLRQFCKEHIEMQNQLAKDDTYRALGFY